VTVVSKGRRPLGEIALPDAPDFLKASNLRWWEYRAMQHKLAQFVEMLGGYRHFGVQFIAGAGCYTDFSHSRVVIDPAMVKARNDVEHLAIVKAMLAHESAHVRFTIPAYGLDTTEMGPKVALTARICNILEDERIERALAHEFWGAERHLFLLKRRMWEQSDNVGTDDSPIHVINAILMLRFGNEVKGTLSAKNQGLLDLCRPHYVRAWNGIDSNVVRESAQEIIKILGLDAISEEELKKLIEPPCSRSMTGKRKDSADAGPGGRTSKSNCPVHGKDAGQKGQKQDATDPNCPVHGEGKDGQSGQDATDPNCPVHGEGKDATTSDKSDDTGKNGQNDAAAGGKPTESGEAASDTAGGAPGEETSGDKNAEPSEGAGNGSPDECASGGANPGGNAPAGADGGQGEPAGGDKSDAAGEGAPGQGEPGAEGAPGKGECTCPGKGKGEGQGAGEGKGEGEGQGKGEGSGQGKGEGSGQGKGEGSGEGQGEGKGSGDCSCPGKGKGQGGQGEGEGSGEGECSCGQGDGQGEGEGAGSGQGGGQGQGAGSGGQAQRQDNDTSDIGKDDEDDGRGLISDEEMEEIMEEAARELAAIFAASGQYGKGAGGPADTQSPLKPRRLLDATYNAATARAQVLRRQLERIPPRPRSYASENGSRYSFRDELRRDDRPMRKRDQPTPKRKVAIGVLVDCSGSMGGVMEEVRKAVLSIYFAADSLKVPMAVWGFSDWSRNPAATLVPYGMNNKLAPEAIAGLDAVGGTVLAPALRKAREAVKGVQADRRVLLVIHDGQPYDMSESVKQVRAMSRETEVVGIFLGSGYTNADLVAPMRELFADRLIVAEDADTLMTILGAFIYRLLRPSTH
jgi:Mg-chelatase subunit ChlD